MGPSDELVAWWRKNGNAVVYGSLPLHAGVRIDAEKKLNALLDEIERLSALPQAPRSRRSEEGQEPMTLLEQVARAGERK